MAYFNRTSEMDPTARQAKKIFGVQGYVAEKYAQDLLNKCVAKSRGAKEGKSEITGASTQNPGDYVILHPNFAILFEIKYRQPDLGCFEDSKKGLEKFKKWFQEKYLLPPEEAKKRGVTPGALYQLERDCKKILEGEMHDIRPKKVLPVILNPQELVFSLPFYKVIDHAIEEKRIFKSDPRILQPLILGLGDLEHLFELNYNEKGKAFSEILLSKAESPAGRLTAWPIVTERNGLESTTSKEASAFLKKLTDETTIFLKLDHANPNDKM